LSLRDTWFFSLPDNDPAKYSWRTGFDHLWKITPDKWKVNPNDVSQGYKPMPSKIYNLGS